MTSWKVGMAMIRWTVDQELMLQTVEKVETLALLNGR
jgi:hypothetical protein